MWGPGSGMAWPFRNTPRDLAKPTRQSSSLIQREIGDRLALALLEGRYGEQHTAVRVDVEDGGIVLK